MIFEVYKKASNTATFIDGNLYMFPHEVLKDSIYKTWRQSVALKQNKLETVGYVVTPKF